MLTVSNLSFAYGGVQVLRDVSMTMEQGRVTSIMGRNGVGKTTLMKNIMGILRPSAGSIHLGETDLTPAPAYQRARLGLALVPQGRQIFPRLTVEENLLLGLESVGRAGGAPPPSRYELLTALKGIGRRMGGDLSGGQQQQLAIARALVGEPKVLLLDEPTEGIQPNIIRQIGEVLHRLVDDGMTVVLVEQYLDFVKEFGHHFYIMDRGRVVTEGDTADLNAQIVHMHLSV
jgi:urea transport system ATP-binding protein